MPEKKEIRAMNTFIHRKIEEKFDGNFQIQGFCVCLFVKVFFILSSIAVHMKLWDVYFQLYGCIAIENKFLVILSVSFLDKFTHTCN